MHPETEQMERLRHRELTPAGEATLRMHVDQCAHCARRMDEAAAEEESIATLLRALDHPAPPMSTAAITGHGRSARAFRRIAAGLVLATATAGALYALPGSPLRAFLGRAPVREAGPIESPQQPAADAAGVAVRPGRHLDIAFTAVQPERVARIRLAAATEASVRAIGGPVAFDVDIGRVVIDNAGANADYEITIPEDAPSVAVHVGESTVFRKDLDRVRSTVEAGADGTFRVPLSVR